MDNPLVEVEYMKEVRVTSSLQTRDKVCSKHLEENKEWFNRFSRLACGGFCWFIYLFELNYYNYNYYCRKA